MGRARCQCAQAQMLNKFPTTQTARSDVYGMNVPGSDAGKIAKLRFFENHERGSRSYRTLDEQLPETDSRRKNSHHDIQKMLQLLTEKWGINPYKLPVQ